MATVSQAVDTRYILHIACATDEEYVPHCATMLASLFDKHEPSSLFIHYLQPQGMSKSVLLRLERFVLDAGARIRFHQIADDRITGLPSWPGLPALIWYRVMLAEILPELDRVLYIDADTLVLDDLRPLWMTDLNDAYLAAVTNVAPPIFSGHALELGLPDRASYFNSGVLLLNLARMRKDNCGGQMLEYGRKHRLKWPDQDVLNMFLYRQRIALHPRWNCMNCIFLFPEAREIFGANRVHQAKQQPAIVHFEGPGPGKPWHYLSKHPHKKDYLAYRSRTPWPLRQLDERTLHNRLLRLLPFKWILFVRACEYRGARWLSRLSRKATRFACIRVF